MLTRRLASRNPRTIEGRITSHRLDSYIACLSCKDSRAATRCGDSIPFLRRAYRHKDTRSIPFSPGIRHCYTARVCALEACRDAYY